MQVNSCQKSYMRSTPSLHWQNLLQCHRQKCQRQSLKLYLPRFLGCCNKIYIAYVYCYSPQLVKASTVLTTVIGIFVESNAVSYASVNNSSMPIEFSFTILRCHWKTLGSEGQQNLKGKTRHVATKWHRLFAFLQHQ